MRTILAPFRTVLTLAGGVLATLIAAPIVIIISRVRPHSLVVDRIARIWSWLWLIASGSTIEIEGQELVDRGRTHIVVANHLSVLDIMASFIAIPLPIRFLAKKELFKVPILAPAMRAFGIVEVDRGARSAIHEQVNFQTRELVESGRSVIIYPEGTRSRSGELRPFKKGAFTMAISGGIPVLPVTIAGTYEAWRPGTFWIRGGRIKVIIDLAIETTDMSREDTTRLADQAHQVIEERYEQLRPKVSR